MLAVKRNSRTDRRKRVTIVVKPPFTLPKKQQRYTRSGKEVRRLDQDECTSHRAEATGSKMGSLEEKREVHRVHERQRHRSLNEAMKELVKILPPGNPFRSVTKYNVLRTANDYIDFLQHKITHLCLERSIEQNTQDGRISFNIPLNTVVGGERLEIPATTPVSPKMLQTVHKAAKDLSTDLIARRGPTESDGRTPPRRFSRSRLAKKSPQATPKTSSTATLSTNSGAVYKGIPQMAFDKPSRPPERLMTCTTPTDSDDSELVVDEAPSQPARLTGPTRTDPGQGDLVVDEAAPLKGSDASAAVASQPKEVPEPTRAVAYGSDEHGDPKKNSRPRKVGSSLSSASNVRKERVRLLDHYIHADASPHGEYALPPATPKPLEECPPSVSASSVIPVGTAPIQSCSLQYQLHSEHSYSAKFLPAYAASGVFNDNKSPNIPVAVAFPSSLESSQILPSAASEPEIVIASESRVSSSTDVFPCILSSSLYIQHPVSFPINMVSCESTIIPTTLPHRSVSKTTRPIPTTVTPSACKSTTRYVPIQPATGTSNIDAVANTLLHLYGQSSLVKNKQPPVTDLSAQKLVVDPHFLKLEDSDSPIEFACDSDQQHAVMTPAAVSGYSMRRSWINGYQLFTKVNHPQFRDKWPRLQGREITRLLSQTWKELPTDFRKQYSCRARQWNQWHKHKRESAASHASAELH
ncbi:uncharacterized protein LOC119746243 [Patiria miniata]|uniref:Uncharacterized protein n=1 Tax=Patiria miniata TaxID=46514 RepID=A0A914BTK7_PATMI|nr:uncharacterized protein LOC119746243 [Patiria miniata]